MQPPAPLPELTEEEERAQHISDLALACSHVPVEGFEMALQHRRGNVNLCRVGHELRPSTFGGGRECDACCLAIRYQSRGLKCDLCTYDLCARCSPAVVVALDLELAFTCSLASARAGYVKAQYLTGQCYELGEGVEKSDTDASHWYPHIEPFYIRQFLY